MNQYLRAGACGVLVEAGSAAWVLAARQHRGRGAGAAAVGWQGNDFIEQNIILQGLPIQDIAYCRIIFSFWDMVDFVLKIPSELGI